jgi:hypothetical protein
VHQNLDRLQLGITLLEIFMRKPIEQYREEDDIGYSGQATTDTNFYTASRVHDEYDWDMYENYKTAVAACLACDIIPDQTNDGPGYGGYIFNKVIKSLETELSTLCNITPEDLDEVIGDSLN